MSRASKKVPICNFEAPPSPSWWARLPVTINIFHTPSDLSNQHCMYIFGQKLLVRGLNLLSQLLVAQHVKICLLCRHLYAHSMGLVYSCCQRTRNCNKSKITTATVSCYLAIHTWTLGKDAIGEFNPTPHHLTIQGLAWSNFVPLLESLSSPIGRVLFFPFLDSKSPFYPH